MKSQQPDKTNKTSCKECILAVYDGKTQTSCIAGRLDKLNHFEAYDDEKEFFVIEQLCNYYRNNKEKYTLEDESIDLDRIEKETRVTFDIIILCNHIDAEFSDYILDLYSYIEDNYTDKFSIQLLYTIATKEQTQAIKDINSKIKNCSTTFYADDIYLHTFLTKTSRSYHAVISKEKRPNKDFPLKLNGLINNDMKKIIVFEYNDCCFISNLAYKITSFQNESTVYGDIVNNIINKAKETSLYYEQE